MSLLKRKCMKMDPIRSTEKKTKNVTKFFTKTLESKGCFWPTYFDTLTFWRKGYCFGERGDN